MDRECMEGAYSDVMESCIGQQCSRHNFFYVNNQYWVQQGTDVCCYCSMFT